MISKYSAENIPEVALSWASKGEPVVLATVIETWGSAPRRVGAQMAIGLNGKMQGSVSGGCIESAVVSEAQEAIETKSIKLLEYGVSNEDAFSVGLACGGKIRVMLEPVGHTISLETLQKLVDFRKNKVSVRKAYYECFRSCRFDVDLLFLLQEKTNPDRGPRIELKIRRKK